MLILLKMTSASYFLLKYTHLLCIFVQRKQFTTKFVHYLDKKHSREEVLWYFLVACLHLEIHLVIRIYLMCPQRSTAQKKAGAQKQRAAQAEGAGPPSSHWLGSETMQKEAENTSRKYVSKNGKLNTLQNTAYVIIHLLFEHAWARLQILSRKNTYVCCLAVRARAEEKEREPAECTRVCSCERNPETCSNFFLVMTSAKGHVNTVNRRLSTVR